MKTRFRNDTGKNMAITAILSRWRRLSLPQPWLVAGCLFQTVWNIQSDRAPGAGIKDYDFFYFDSGDLRRDTAGRGLLALWARRHLRRDVDAESPDAIPGALSPKG